MITVKNYAALFLVNVFLAGCYYGTGTREKKITPDEYLYHVEIESIDYSRDSLRVYSKLHQLLISQKQSFYSKEYFDSTELIIDTVIYSPKADRLAVLVISKNPTSRQLKPDTRNESYYNATCYIGIKKDDSVTLAWIGPNFSNAENQSEISSIIRDACFTGFAQKDSTSLYPYNLNDRRFWDGAIWEKKFEGLIEN